MAWTGLLIALSVIGGCSNPPAIGKMIPSPSEQVAGYQPEAVAHRGGAITVGDWESPTNFAPLFNAEQPAAEVDALLYAGLVRETADLQFIPDLATRVPTLSNGDVAWDRQAGTMAVTYHLRAGLAWSDGIPLTATDVAYTWRTIVDPKVQPSVVSLDGYTDISRVDVPDPLTVVLHFDRVYPQYLQLFAAVLPEHRLRDIPGDRLADDGFWARPDVVCGPFKISELVPDDHITLVRNEQWSAGRAGRRPALDQIVFRIYPELGQLVDAARAGQVDLALEIPDEALSQLASGKDGMRTRPSLAYEQVTFNQSDPDPLTGQSPLWKDDPLLLEALRIAVNRPAMVQSLLGGRARVADSPIPSALAGYHLAVTPATFDPGEAGRLLDQDGWTVGSDGIRVKDGRRLNFSLTAALGDPLRLSLQDALVNAWKAIGADVTVRDAHTSELFSGFDQGGWLERGEFEAGLWTWSIGPDPDGVYPIDHSSQIPSAQNLGRGANFGRVQSPAIDASLDRGRTTLADSERVQAYRSFEQAYARLGAELPLYERMLTAMVSPRLHNVQLNPAPDTTLWNAADWWID